MLREVSIGPEELPPVTPFQLSQAWEAASAAASAATMPADRDLGVRFRRPDGDETRVIFADADACAWARALDEIWGLESPHGLSLCFRLLGLVELVASSPPLRSLIDFQGGGMEVSPALFSAAASLPLNRDGRFDPEQFNRRLAPKLVGRGG